MRLWIIFEPWSSLWSFCPGWMWTGRWIIMLWRYFRNENVSRNLTRFAKCRPFREATELQAGPCSFQHTWCTQNVKLLFGIIWKVNQLRTCAALPLTSSSVPLNRLFRARPSVTLQANLGPSQTITQATALLEVEEDGAAFLYPREVSASPPEIQ
jgi:hypothetical protein